MPFKKAEVMLLNTPVTTKLNAVEYQELVAQAELQGTTKTALLRLAIRQYLERNEACPETF